MTRRIITALALIAIVFTLSACEGTARTNAGRQSTETQQPRTESSKRYARMWVKYQLCIGKLAKLTDPYAQQNLKQWRGYGRKADAEVRKRGSEILKELQARAKSNHLGKLDFEGECPERKYFSSASDASATLFGILYREGKVDPGYLADMLSQSHLPIADGWIPVLQDITAKAEPDSEAQRTAVRTLYSVGVGRDRYRPTLEKWARGLDSPATCTLLYHADRGLREYEIIKSPANHALVDDILKRKPRP
ncbi:MAG: hypothetical protein NTU88_16720, partial [Armatimonadetes bacterium]|nr:hypothetical protein [Armatimonadota bacterium]